MKVVKPTPIGIDQLISSTAPETEYAAYVPATDYAVFARCIFAHKIWESVQTPNVGHEPGTDALYWAEKGPTNKWAMFDGKISTPTVLASPLTVVLALGYSNSIGLFGLVGNTLDITVRNGLAGEIVYSRTLSLDGTVIASWYQYFFEPRVQLGEVVLTDLPPYLNAHITVTISGAGAVQCGDLIVGTFYDLGDTQKGASAGIIDYSRKDTSAAGEITLQERGFSKRMSAQMQLNTTQINKVQRILASVRAVSCAWIGTDVPGYEPLTMFGIYRDFSIDIPDSALSLCSIEIEGLSQL